MFWTALVWGLGVSLGASIGLMAFIVMYALFKAFVESDTAKKIEEYHERSYQALVDRNELSRVMIQYAAAIAAAAERYEDSLEKKP